MHPAALHVVTLAPDPLVLLRSDHLAAALLGSAAEDALDVPAFSARTLLFRARNPFVSCVSSTPILTQVLQERCMLKSISNAEPSTKAYHLVPHVSIRLGTASFADTAFHQRGGSSPINAATIRIGQPGMWIREARTT